MAGCDAGGFTRLVPFILLLVLYGISIVLLRLALKRIDLSTADAIWTGAGTALVAAIGFCFFNEPPTLLRISCILLIVLGVVGLKLAPARRAQGTPLG